MASRRPSPGALLAFVWRHPANRGRRLRALADTARWQLRKRVLHRDGLTRLPHDLWLEVPRDSTVASLAVYTGGLPDFHEMHAMRRLLRPGARMADVGANIGLWTLLAAARGADVIAVEPSARARARLRQNLRRNHLEHRVQVIDAVVAERDGLAIEFVEGSDTTNRIHTAHTLLAGHERTSVRTTCTLDTLCAGDHEPPAVIKVDVEGAEPRVLEGAANLLDAAAPPVWILEWSRALRRYGTEPRALQRALADRGWLLAAWDEHLRHLTVHRTWCSAVDPERGAPHNLLLVAERALDAVRARLHRAE